MLALQDRAAYRRDRTDAQGQAPGWAARPPGPSLHFREGDDSAPLSALAGDALGAHFRSWRGASGRRYVFSIYGPPSCPAYDHAVIVVAAVDAAGDRTDVFIADTGCFPEIVLASAAAKWTRADAEIEFHIHLLAKSPAERRALISDLSHPPRS
ncbi:MAG: hypothetical protein ABSE69_01835 [Roseiarcus sp.]